MAFWVGDSFCVNARDRKFLGSGSSSSEPWDFLL